MSARRHNRTRHGERNLTVGHIRTLAAHFHVSPEVLL